MRQWKRESAVRAIESLHLVGSNRQIAEYWLSLWQGTRPPVQASFDPARIPLLLPAVTIMEVHPDGRFIFRFAGDYYSQMLYGRDMTGKDALPLTPPEQREQRIRNTAEIVAGTIVYARRPTIGQDGRKRLMEEICLPFADPAADGSRSYLCHTNWRPRKEDQDLLEEPRLQLGIAPERIAIPLES